jgi:dTDP-4-amino-4,6-dideoxygalactose transaminase
VEGGAVVLHDEDSDRELRLLRSFGHIGDEHFSLGMNAKMSEVHAAMGMAVLPHMERIIEQRSGITGQYQEQLEDLLLECPTVPQHTLYNFAYYPILLRHGPEREGLLRTMAEGAIHLRRYFFPSLDTLPYVHPYVCQRSRDLSERVLCLPLYNGLEVDEVERICNGIRNYLEQSRQTLPDPTMWP